jgi:hypothetical protein
VCYLNLRDDYKTVLSRHKLGVLVGALLALLFILPFVIDFFIHSPSNVEKIAGHTFLEHHSHPKLVNIFQVTSSTVFTGYSVVTFILLIWGSFVMTTDPARKPLWASCLKMAAIVTVWYTLYHKFTPSPILFNMILFTKAIPLALSLIAAVGLLLSAQQLSKRSHRFFIPALAFGMALIGVLHLRPLFTDIQTNHSVIGLADAVQSANKDKPQIRIDYDNHDQWPEVVALLFELKHRNLAVCTTWRYMAFLYTQPMVCEENAVATVKLVPPVKCEQKCVSVVGNTGIIPLD